MIVVVEKNTMLSESIYTLDLPH